MTEKPPEEDSTASAAGAPTDDSTADPAGPGDPAHSAGEPGLSATGITSAQPVGWPDSRAPAGRNPDQPPPSGWIMPPVPARVAVTDDLVIAGTFARLVAYSADSLFLLAINVVIGASVGIYSDRIDETFGLVVGALLVALDLVYFVGLWTSGWQATIGMRLLRLRVLAAPTAAGLSVNDALLRWLALSGALSILTLVPGIGNVSGLASLVWILVLLISTMTSPLKQGLHDRWARSVVVQPVTAGSRAAIIGCAVLVVIVVVVIPAAMLLVAGDAIREILSQVGESV